MFQCCSIPEYHKILFAAVLDLQMTAIRIHRRTTVSLSLWSIQIFPSIWPHKYLRIQTNTYQNSYHLFIHQSVVRVRNRSWVIKALLTGSSRASVSFETEELQLKERLYPPASISYSGNRIMESCAAMASAIIEPWATSPIPKDESRIEAIIEAFVSFSDPEALYTDHNVPYILNIPIHWNTCKYTAHKYIWIQTNYHEYLSNTNEHLHISSVLTYQYMPIHAIHYFFAW